MWKGKKVFVTGADGFIGSWIAKELVKKGAEVSVIIRDFNKDNGLDLQKIRDKVNIIQGDFTDYKVVERIINEKSIEFIFHLGAQALVGIANRNPLSTFESNIKGTWTILEAARNSKLIKGVIVASSDKAYGVQEKLPYTEDDPLWGLYPYDSSKVCTDVLARMYFNAYGLPVVVTRNANTYGGGDLNYGRIVPDIIYGCLNGKDIEIRSDGTPERDYMYIQDAVDGYLALAEKIDKTKGEAFNFGTETPISVLDLTNKVIGLIGAKVKPKVLGKATNEIDKQYLAIKKAKEKLGWTPKYSLDEGLKETIAWYKKHLKEE